MAMAPPPPPPPARGGTARRRSEANATSPRPEGSKRGSLASSRRPSTASPRQALPPHRPRRALPAGRSRARRGAGPRGGRSSGGDARTDVAGVPRGVRRPAGGLLARPQGLRARRRARDRGPLRPAGVGGRDSGRRPHLGVAPPLHGSCSRSSSRSASAVPSSGWTASARVPRSTATASRSSTSFSGSSRQRRSPPTRGTRWRRTTRVGSSRPSRSSSTGSSGTCCCSTGAASARSPSRSSSRTCHCSSRSPSGRPRAP